MNITKIPGNTVKKDENSRAIPAVSGHRFFCAGEGCTETEKCVQWNHWCFKGSRLNN